VNVHTDMRVLGAFVLTLTLAACGASADSPSGGVRGTVTAGPACPVERQGSPCPPAPWIGTVRATSSGGRTFAAATDAGGVYQLHLPDGSYTVTAVIEGSGPPTAKPAQVTVSGGVMQTLDLQVDTGIR
jgi:hypothetical protein